MAQRMPRVPAGTHRPEGCRLGREEAIQLSAAHSSHRAHKWKPQSCPCSQYQLGEDHAIAKDKPERGYGKLCFEHSAVCKSLEAQQGSACCLAQLLYRCCSKQCPPPVISPQHCNQTAAGAASHISPNHVATWEREMAPLQQSHPKAQARPTVPVCCWETQKPRHG